jgi:hypothetical protein
MVKFSTIKEIANKLDLPTYEYDYIGIRIQEMDAEIGTVMTHNSKTWIDGTETDENLNGVCAIDVTRTNQLTGFGGYFGNYILILGSYNATYGEDQCELIMQDAIILKTIKVEEVKQ